ncbi:unnamed protein product [Vicia faba]|uniref:CCHC-type domain-containing protein n=1 Tax=Vicia faba TaxID=3906 RepID=A0AAV1B787_VICFA|nr:unnamed protein product [Vicia faba]
MAGTATGCYKCGKPGHWSRDCPFSAPDSNSNPNPNSNTADLPPSSSSNPLGPRSAIEKPKKPPRIRPKLTPGLLLSDDGLGYVLRYFPRSFKYHGRGHEVRDLGNLIELYSEWHSRLLPYYPFNQFVHKVEQVAATKHVKMSLRELRERVANGGDPSKLHEPPGVQNSPVAEQENGDVTHQENEMFDEPENVIDIQEDMLNDIYDKATKEPSQPMQNVIGVSTDPESSAIEKTSNEAPNNGASLSSNAEITAEQRARMEANRLKAIGKKSNEVPNNGASLSSNAEITEEQRARMEANRLKALERRAARASLSQAS